MSDTVISVEGLGKKYRIRHQKTERYTALRDVIARKVRGKAENSDGADVAMGDGTMVGDCRDGGAVAACGGGQIGTREWEIPVMAPASTKMPMTRKETYL